MPDLGGRPVILSQRRSSRLACGHSGVSAGRLGLRAGLGSHNLRRGGLGGDELFRNWLDRMGRLSLGLRFG